jgi:hypothetical protein
MNDTRADKLAPPFEVPGYKTGAELDAEYFRRFGKLPPGALSSLN